MANVATSRTGLPIKFKGSGAGQVVIPVIVTMDTAAADLTIYTPANALYCAGIIGITGGDSAAHNLTIKAGSTTLTVLKFAASLPPLAIPTQAPLVMGGPGEALKFNISAGTPSYIVYILEFESLYFLA